MKSDTDTDTEPVTQNELFPQEHELYQNPKINFLFRLLDAHEKRIEFESGWIGHRITWLVGAQSFLFAAFAIAMDSENKTLGFALLWIVAVSALIQSLFAYISILGAKQGRL